MSNWWNGFPWRVIQPNFREIDTRNFDEDSFIESLEAFSCNVVMLNAAGLIASYPTKLEDHMASKYLDDFDLKHLVDRCHEKGVRVIARTDFSKIPLSVYEKHPDWAYRKPDGEPLIYNGFVQTCLSGGYQGGYIDEILREMFAEIPFDGIYCNMGTAMGYVVDYSMNRHGPCQCEACRKSFKSKYGMDVPLELSRTDRSSMIYFRFQQELAGAQKKRITQLLRQIDPEMAYCSVDYIRQEANSEFGRELPHWMYQASSHARAIRGTGQEADVADVDFMGFAYRHVTTTPAMQELRLWQILSNFGGLDYYVMGRLYDKEDQSAYSRVQKVFRYAADHEDICAGISSDADVLLARDSYVIPDAEERGWIRALTELHILFDEALVSALDSRDLSQYRVIILPEKTRIAPSAAEKLTAWVEQGGTLLASGQLPGLKCFGVKGDSTRNSQALGATIRMEDADRPLFMVGKIYWEREYEEEAELIGRYCMPERFGPPELCYPTEESTAMPGIVRMPCGHGCGVSIPWYPATNYYTDGFDNWLVFLRYALCDVCGCVTVSQSLNPMVEVTHGYKDEMHIVHFINGSGHYGNSFFDPAVLCDQTVRILWPHDSAKCENLDDPGNIRWELAEGVLTITVPKLGAHAGIIIEQ